MRKGKSKKIGLAAKVRARLGYIVITLCIGLVCFYIGRVEFLAEKLQEAEKIGRMTSEGVNQQIAMHGYQHQPVVPQPPQVASQARPQAPNNVLNNNLIQQAPQNPPVPVNLQKVHAGIQNLPQDVKARENAHQNTVQNFALGNALEPAAKVMEQVERLVAQEVHDTVGAIENAAGAVNNAVHNVINVGKQIEENINLNFQPEELLPEPQDRPSLDIAALIASANRISVETIFQDQQAELAKYPTSHLKASAFYTYEPAKWNWQSMNFKTRTPNAKFIFHNKLPKSGSSTMNQLLRQLSKKNNFNFAKVEPSQIPNDRFDLEKPLVKFVQETKKEPFFLLKHHFWFNFTRHGLRQPTYVNVIRDPVDWYTSQYYFRRFGWVQQTTTRDSFAGTQADRDRTIDQCIQQGLMECTKPSYKYIQYLCGNHPHCRTVDVSEELKEKAANLAKINVLRNFYAVGILEQFVDTLKTFEIILPNYYSGVLDIWNSSMMQEKRNKTKTLNRKELSSHSREFLMKGPLKWETDLYIFVRALFNERLRRYEIVPTGVQIT
ncbi:Oidioi.mRNA.OKI2018_I69.chr1.g2491.t2.cds [Oikopleura dioica]|uniref:Oidioi.mRNA.OKI2018_I69.chr1.g2491.t2.cds n=1 Tax=Oikopleura dioica TaxID=34765 RepID=A0ABN7SR82_OIKDI|nr:Oidioi.mRNA.OKI2018_I69.chr1.g2491.t2.cds [Oikopleura dioica]